MTAPVFTGVKRKLDENNDGKCTEGSEGGEIQSKSRRLSANTIVVARLMEAADHVDAMDELEELRMKNKGINSVCDIKGDEDEEEEEEEEEEEGVPFAKKVLIIPQHLTSSVAPSFMATTKPLTTTIAQTSAPSIPTAFVPNFSPQVNTVSKTPAKQDSKVVEQVTVQQQQQPVKKSDVSLTKLAQRFIGYMKSKPDLTVDLNDAALALSTPKRRIYDITNVLEGTGFLCKVSKSVVRWKGDTDTTVASVDNSSSAQQQQQSAQEKAEQPPAKLLAEAKANGFPIERLNKKSLIEDIERMKEEVAALNARAAAAREEKNSLTKQPATRDLLYVTEEDLGSVKMLQDAAFVVVCSPYGGRLEVACDMQNEIFVNTATGSISMATFNFRNETDYDGGSSDTGSDPKDGQYESNGRRPDDFFSCKHFLFAKKKLFYVVVLDFITTVLCLFVCFLVNGW